MIYKEFRCRQNFEGNVPTVRRPILLSRSRCESTLLRNTRNGASVSLFERFLFHPIQTRTISLIVRSSSSLLLRERASRICGGEWSHMHERKILHGEVCIQAEFFHKIIKRKKQTVRKIIIKTRRWKLPSLLLRALLAHEGASVVGQVRAARAATNVRVAVHEALVIAKLTACASSWALRFEDRCRRNHGCGCQD